jgi:hypothetical protein
MRVDDGRRTVAHCVSHAATQPPGHPATQADKARPARSTKTFLTGLAAQGILSQTILKVDFI